MFKSRGCDPDLLGQSGLQAGWRYSPEGSEGPSKSHPCSESPEEDLLSSQPSGALLEPPRPSLPRARPSAPTRPSDAKGSSPLTHDTLLLVQTDSELGNSESRGTQALALLQLKALPLKVLMGPEI